LRDRVLRRAGTVADVAWNRMVDGQGGAVMRDADIDAAVDRALGRV